MKILAWILYAPFLIFAFLMWLFYFAWVIINDEHE